MGKKLGWYEVEQDTADASIKIKIFSFKWREAEKDPDCYYGDIVLYMTMTGGTWFISEMVLSNPTIEEFNEIAIDVLKIFQKEDPETLPATLKLLDRVLTHEIPDFAV